MAINLIYIWLIALPLFAFVVFLEIKGINRKIYNWVLGILKTSISLKDALAIIENSNINVLTDYDILSDILAEKERLPDEFQTLLALAEQGKVTLYGHKHFSTNRVPSQPIPVNYLLSYKDNWSDDYVTLYYNNSKDIAYTDIVVKEKELKQALFNIMDEIKSQG